MIWNRLVCSHICLETKLIHLLCLLASAGQQYKLIKPSMTVMATDHNTCGWHTANHFLCLPKWRKWIITLYICATWKSLWLTYKMTVNDLPKLMSITNWTSFSYKAITCTHVVIYWYQNLHYIHKMKNYITYNITHHYLSRGMLWRCANLDATFSCLSLLLNTMVLNGYFD